MTLVNTLKTQVDLPVWEWLRFAPAVSSAVSAACSSDNSLYHPNHGRYIYYIIATANFWRYDTWTDTYLQLASSPVTTTTATSMKFGGAIGHYGRAISATSNTITTDTISGEILKGFDIKIISGTGAGQQRTITAVSDPVTADAGIATSVTSSTSLLRITDSTKNWAINQWVGYQVRITGGSGIGQVRKILYSDATSITFGDINQLTQNNVDAMAPLVTAISATAGSQSFYSIESGALTVDSNWAVNPDETSRFVVQSGGIYLLTNVAGGLVYYDIAADIWYNRTLPTNVISNITITDLSLERTTENASVWEKGVASSGTTTTLVDNTKSWNTNEFANYYVRIFSGTGEGQLRPIASNTSNTLTWSSSGTAPNSTSRYIIEGFDAGTASSATSTTLVDSSKSWSTNRWANHRVVITGGTGIGQSRIIKSNTSDTLSISQSFKINPDNTSTYKIQGDNDLLYAAYGAQACLYTSCAEEDTWSGNKKLDGGVSRSGAAQYGEDKPISISTTTRSGTTATVTTTLNHNFKTGYSVTHTGATGGDASLYNIAAAITVTSGTTYTYTMVGTPTANATFTAQSATTLTDSTKSWTTNEWAGHVCYMTTTLSNAPTGQTFRIASNTSNTLTFTATATAPTNGTTKYIISKPAALGASDSGIATGTHSTTTLQDTTKVAASSFTASISGNVLTVTAKSSGGSLGPGQTISGTNVPSGTIILDYITGSGDTGTYQVNTPSSTSVSSTTMSMNGWVVNYFAGKRLKFVGGAGVTQETAISSNTTTTLTFTAVTTAPTSASTVYSILNTPIKGAGINLNWIYGSSDINKRGLFLITARGGAVVGFDEYNIAKDSWDIVVPTPITETLTTGSMYAYDGGDRLYFTKEVTTRCYYIDILTNSIHGAGIYPYIAGTAIIGNRMEIFETPDGLKYLWLNRHSNLECFRCLLFY
jgi:hypothetical protein